MFRPVPVLFLVLALGAGCSSVSPEKYAQVQSGMSRQEVYALLGEPDEVSGGGLGALTVSAETWKGRRHVVHITFAGDKVALKSIQSNDGRSER